MKGGFVIVFQCFNIHILYFTHTHHTLSHTHWTDYKNGIQLYSSHDAKAMFQCNCDSSDDRVKLLRTLEATISEVRDTHNL